MGKEATNELTSYLWLTARAVESLKKKRRRCSEKQPRKRRLSVFAAKFVASHLNGGGVNANHYVWTRSPSLAHKKNWEWRRKSRRWVEVLSRERSEKSSKQTSRLQPETGQSKATNLETQEQTKRIEIYYSQIKNHGLLNWFSKRVFPKRSAKMINGTEKPKIPSKFAKRAARCN